MAQKRRKTTGSRTGNGTLFGILIGLILGLVAAVAVALFVTQVPMPFSDKASRDPAKTLLPDVRDAPDPNLGLYGNDSPAGTIARGPVDTTIAPPVAGEAPATPAQRPVPSGPDNIGELIASLTKSGTKADKTPPPAPKPPPGTEPPPGTQTTYYLQAGAFRSSKDAEALMARIVMLGLPAKIQKAEINGSTINRVRVGPFKGIDEMNHSRATLGEQKIETTVVRP